jgi:hypothetical protein
VGRQQPALISEEDKPDKKVMDASARALRMIYQSKIAPKFDVNNGENMDFLLSLLSSENENVTELAATIISRRTISPMQRWSSKETC